MNDKLTELHNLHAFITLDQWNKLRTIAYYSNRTITDIIKEAIDKLEVKKHE